MPRIKPLGAEAQEKRKIEEFASWVQRELNKRNLKQEELANELGITRPALNPKLHGKRDFSGSEMIRIFRLFKTEPEQINHLLGWRDIS